MPTLDIHSPLQAAVDQMAARVVVGSPRTAAQWALLPAELRLRYMFSARVEHERTLAEMQARITDALAGRKREGVTMDKGRFVEEMREIVRATGYKRPEGTHRKSIRNLKSRARLELIWEMNRAQAIGYAKWLKDMDPDLLEASPCYELVRVMARQEPRDWPTIWQAAGGEFYSGRMIAKKTDPIWVRISRFGTPWPPFDWGSGMGLRGVRRAEAEKLGAVSPDDEPQARQAKPFNEEHSASAKGIPQERVNAILRDFAGDVELRDGRLRIIPPTAQAPSGEHPRAKVSAPRFVKRHQPPPHRSDKSLSDAVTAPGHKEASRGIALAASVHRDGVLPPVVAARERLRSGAAGDYAPTSHGSSPPQLRVSPDAIDPAWAAIHELGHLLDNHGLHSPSADRRYASAGQPSMLPLMLAIFRSTAFMRLMVRARAEGVPYWVTSHELFARAYAQWIAHETGDPALLATWEAIRSGKWERHRVWKESQWSKADFAPIRSAFRDLFTNLQWLPGQ